MTKPITIISSMATRQILHELTATYSRNTGRAVEVQSVGGVDAARRIRAGEVFDIVVLASDALQALSDDGFVAGDSIREFARSPTAMAVGARPRGPSEMPVGARPRGPSEMAVGARARGPGDMPVGGLHPAPCDEDAIKALIASVQRIGVSTGRSGTGIAMLLTRWGMLDPAARWIVQAAPGVPVARLLANGDADVGFQQLSELIGQPGIEIVGIVPEALQPMTVFACGLGRAADGIGAHALQRALVSDATAATKRQNGMEPAGARPVRD